MSFSIPSDSGSKRSSLSSRKGSLSAPDPFAHNVNLDAFRGQTSRLTIMRVREVPNPASDQSPRENVLTLQKPRARSHSSATALGGGHARTGSEDDEGKNTRLSFARSSFSAGCKPTIGGGLTSDPASSRSTPTSSSSSDSPFTAKNRTHSFSTRGASKFQTRRPSLTPQQICDLAESSLKLATVEGTTDIASSPLFHPSRDSPPSGSSSQDLPGAMPGPLASFTPLPDSHYLPFVDRPSEITTLLSSDGNSGYMALLKQTFPSHLRDNIGNRGELDPIDWPYPRLVSFLTECPRTTCADKKWAINARRCIRARSEVVWERFKDVLGVPPELDVDELPDNDEEGGSETSESEEEIEEAWVEPIFPASYSLASASPQVSSAPLGDTGDDGFGYGGRMRNMETIGEREEEDSVATVTNTRANSLEDEKSRIESSAEHIHALRLHTRMSFSEEPAPPLEPRASPPSNDKGTARLARSFSEGHANTGVPFFSEGRVRSFSFANSRRPRTASGRPQLDRGPGNPLFPSNFGRLSIAPTLPANNPELRDQASPVPSAYFPRRFTLAVPEDGGRVTEDHLNRSISTDSDYAVTLASGSDKSLEVSRTLTPTEHTSQI